MEVGIDILEFPQTLKDAVKVRRELGQEYLWVKPLCIVQLTDAMLHEWYPKWRISIAEPT